MSDKQPSLSEPWARAINTMEGTEATPDWHLCFGDVRFGSGFTHTALYTGEQLSAIRASSADEIDRLRDENADLRTVMIAAAEEIHQHWQAHCDAEGYGPVNLQRRLEQGIPAKYGYTAGDFETLHAELKALKAQEPVAWMNPDTGFAPDAFIWTRDERCHPEYKVPVFASPVPPAPAQAAARWLLGLPSEPLGDHAVWFHRPTASDIALAESGTGQTGFIITPLYAGAPPTQKEPGLTECLPALESAYRTLRMYDQRIEQDDLAVVRRMKTDETLTAINAILAAAQKEAP